MKKQKAIFITGATGFVGSNLTYELLNHGYRLMLLVRGENAKDRIDRLLCRLYRHPEKYNKVKERLEIINGDIIKKNLGISSKNIDKLSKEAGKVFHCAASVSFDETRKGKIEKQNVSGTKNMLEFMRRINLHELHYISTAYVAGQRTGVVYEDELDENQSFNNTYEESKFNAEKLVRKCIKEYDIISTIYRPSIIVGNSKTGKTSSFLGFYSYIKSLYILMRIFKKDLKKDGKRSELAGVYYRGNLLYMPLRVQGLTGKTLNLLPIDYVVDVIMKIFKSEANYNKTYHITNPNPPTLEHIQRSISDSLGVSGVEIVDPLNFQTNPMSQWEKFFAETIKSFAPYFYKEEPIFSNANTQKVLNGTHVKCPYIAENLMSRLISYCVNTDWGKNI